MIQSSIPTPPSPPLRLLVVGATGGTGRELVKQALELGHHVTAFVRKSGKVRIVHRNLRVAEGDVMDYASVDRAMAGQDAVLCALGHKRWIIKTNILSEGTRTIIRAMEAHKVRRLVCETSLGVDDSWGRLGIQYTLLLIPLLLFFYFRDKKIQEWQIRKSPVEWVIVRPGVLTNGRRRAKYRHGPGVGNYIWTVRISRASVADFMLKQVTDDTYLRKAVGVAN